MAKLLTGAPVAEALNQTTRARAEALRIRGVTPTLAILRLGERPGDLAYEQGAVKRCAEVGVAVKKVTLAGEASEDELIAAIRQVNADPEIHAALLFRPLPRRIDEDRVRNSLAVCKDVDGITDGSLAGVFTGAPSGFPPCTAQACLEILDYYGVQVSGKRVVVVGRSLVVGRPLAMLLLQRNATLTICHTRTCDLPGVCRAADVLIAAAGQANLIDRDYLNPGQVVIDVGIHILEDGGQCGDVCFSAAEGIVRAITPVPGGVGTVTTSVLARQVVGAAEMNRGQA